MTCLHASSVMSCHSIKSRCVLYMRRRPSAFVLYIMNTYINDSQCLIIFLQKFSPTLSGLGSYRPYYRPGAGPASFFSGVRIRLGMIFSYLILWVRVKGQG